MSFSATLNPSPGTPLGSVFLVFLARNGVVDFNASDVLGGAVAFNGNPFGANFETVVVTGILLDVRCCTKLTLQTAAIGAPPPATLPVEVTSWELNLHKID